MRYEIHTVQFWLHCTIYILIRFFLHLHGSDIYTLDHAQTHAEKIENCYLQQKKRKSTRQSYTESVSNEGEKNFSWTGEEMALLLQVIIAYKAEKTLERLDWDTVRTKYDGILEKFIEHYPNNVAIHVNFHTAKIKACSQRIVLLQKLKKQLCFRKAIDFSSKSY